MNPWSHSSRFGLFQVKNTSPQKHLIHSCRQGMFCNQKAVLFFFFLISPQKNNNIVGTQWKHLNVALLTSTPNVCFCEGVRKIFTHSYVLWVLISHFYLIYAEQTLPHYILEESNFNFRYTRL